jgi:hypothetical protein
MESVNSWCRLSMVTPDGRVRAVWLLSGPGRPDLAAVDDIARLAVVASRRRERLFLLDVAPDLGALIRLAGLPVDVGGLAADVADLETENLRIEMERQPERREQAVVVEEVEEEGHLGDLPA